MQKSKMVGVVNSIFSPTLNFEAIKLETLDELTKNANREISQAYENQEIFLTATNIFAVL